ncbi:histone acetyltransferase [Gonapodya sp. JEL0774]|nr:histone acetyltransferase [Gonapodya sp. JEL0774]
MVPPVNSSEFAALDTNGNGVLDSGDAPYIDNFVPDRDYLVRTITGKEILTGATVSESFYHVYAQNKTKPFIFAEFGVYHWPNGTGATALEQKQGMWRLLLNETTRAEFSLLKAAAWFEVAKIESGWNDTFIDFKISSDPSVMSAFLTDISPSGAAASGIDSTSGNSFASSNAPSKRKLGGIDEDEPRRDGSAPKRSRIDSAGSVVSGVGTGDDFSGAGLDVDSQGDGDDENRDPNVQTDDAYPPGDGVTEESKEGEEETEEEQKDEGPPRSKRHTVAREEEEKGIIRFETVVNDGDRKSMIILTGLKNIFQKQLPKMPKEYIARLVYDRNHVGMAIVRDNLKVVGGITYRPFVHRKFAEIVFCAISSTEQVKGYGALLMSHLKDFVRPQGMLHFLTYADNYAIGYFKKQGFTTEITLDRSVWVGYIKDYEGGTLMQCTMLEKVQYLQMFEILDIQKQAVLEKIKQTTRSHIVYPGIDAFKTRQVYEIDPMSIPGVKEAGWSLDMENMPRRQPPAPRGPLWAAMSQLASDLKKHNQAWPFLEPVAGVPDYYEIIKEPMDLRTLGTKVDEGAYETMEEFARDVQKIFDNCRQYNEPATPYVKCANALERYFLQRFKQKRQELGR